MRLQAWQPEASAQYAAASGWQGSAPAFAAAASAVTCVSLSTCKLGGPSRCTFSPHAFHLQLASVRDRAVGATGIGLEYLLVSVWPQVATALGQLARPVLAAVPSYLSLASGSVGTKTRGGTDTGGGTIDTHDCELKRAWNISD